jgi:hypothetical protein
MISNKTALWFMTVDWVVAGLSGLLTGFLTYQQAPHLNPMNFVDAAMLLGLAFGIFHKSRVCAVLALGYYVANQIAVLRLLHGAITATGLVGVAVFVAIYSLGIVGAFAWHRSSSIGPVEPTAMSAERIR